MSVKLVPTKNTFKHLFGITSMTLSQIPICKMVSQILALLKGTTTTTTTTTSEYKSRAIIIMY
jgi:hypothetical protein